MRESFVRYLAESGLVPEPEARRASSATLCFRELIGVIAVSHGLLTMQQVDTVLAHLTDGRRFGEVAVELGFLTPDQVRMLLEVQELHELVEIGEELLLRGILTRPQLAGALAGFFQTVEQKCRAAN